MTQHDNAQKGDKVKVHYTGTLGNGEQFDTSEGREPLEFELGAGMVIPGFDNAITGMAKGEKATVTIPSAEAYGPRQDELIQKVPMDFFNGETPQVGWMLQLQSPEGQILPAVVTAIDDDGVTLDINHPLAGQDLTFEIELVDFEKALPQEGEASDEE